jgi:ubiquinone biosynthesis protein COQ4
MPLHRPKIGTADRWSRRNWPAAIKAFRRLMANRQDTAQVFVIIRSLAGRSVERGYRRLLNTPQGGRIAYERRELVGRLADPAWLANFPSGSVADALRIFTRPDRLSAAQLARRSRRGLDLGRNDVPHPYAWFGRRIRDTHDIWHVLTGYGSDPLGEACLAAFSYAQTGGLGWALIALGACFHVGATNGHPMRRAIWEGWRLGRRAAWLPPEDDETLLAEPLVAARARLGLTPPRHYLAVPPDYRSGQYTHAGAQAPS